MTYAELEADRARFVAAFNLGDKPLSALEATSLIKMSNTLGRLRRRLGDTGGGWSDELVEETVDSFTQVFDGLSDDDLKTKPWLPR